MSDIWKSNQNNNVSEWWCRRAATSLISDDASKLAWRRQKQKHSRRAGGGRRTEGGGGGLIAAEEPSWKPQGWDRVFTRPGGGRARHRGPVCVRVSARVSSGGHTSCLCNTGGATVVDSNGSSQRSPVTLSQTWPKQSVRWNLSSVTFAVSRWWRRWDTPGQIGNGQEGKMPWLLSSVNLLFLFDRFKFHWCTSSVSLVPVMRWHF